MKKFFSILCFAALGLIAATSCGNKAAESAEVETVPVDSIVANPEQYLGDTITIEGVVSHLCKHGGRKAFVLGSDDNTMIRCEATAEMGGAFPQDCIHKPIRVTGYVVESRIGEAEVQQMEQQHAEQVKMIAEQVGEEEAAAADNAASGCETERKAAGQGDIDTFEAQMANYRERIAAREAAEGKPYISSFYIIALSYEILPE